MKIFNLIKYLYNIYLKVIFFSICTHTKLHNFYKNWD